jgi:AcrR family transcriptional regulator
MVARRQDQLLIRFEEVTQSSDSGCEQVRSLLRSYASHMNEPPHHFKLAMSLWVAGTAFDSELENGAAMQTNIARLFGMMCHAIDRGQTDGSLRSDLPSPQAALKLWTAVNGALLLRLQLACMPPSSPLSEFAGTVDDSVDFIIDAMRPRRRAEAGA